MPRLHRPYVPILVRLLVTAQQLLAAGVNIFAEYSREEGESLTALLERRLERIAQILGCKRSELALDHDPALGLRRFDRKRKVYTPAANDYRFLVYRTRKDNHDKAAGRGGKHRVGGETRAISRTDRLERTPRLVQARNGGWRKETPAEIERRAGPPRRKAATFKRPKRKWASRPFPKGRKMRSRR